MKLIHLVALLFVSCTTKDMTKSELEIVFSQGVSEEGCKRKVAVTPYSETDWYKIIKTRKREYGYSLYCGTVVFTDSKYYYIYPFTRMGKFSLPKVPTDDKLVIKKSIKLTNEDIKIILENVQ